MPAARAELQGKFLGPVTLLAVPLSPEELKARCVAFERADTFGDFCDADVWAGHPLSRAAARLPPRRCLVCHRPAKECIVGCRHTRHTVLTTTWLRLAVATARATHNAINNRRRTPWLN